MDLVGSVISSMYGGGGRMQVIGCELAASLWANQLARAVSVFYRLPTEDTVPYSWV
jgi:hypothetical protein